MKKLILFSVFAVVLALIAGHASELSASSREVLLEDLRFGNIDDNLHHRPERPGKIVRVVPWIGEDGAYSVLAITEVGWVYQAHGADDWNLVGRVYHSEPLQRGTGHGRFSPDLR